MTDWIVEPLIARRALTLVSGGAHALEVGLALAASVTRGYGLPGPDGWARDYSMQADVIVCGVDLERLRDADADMDNVHALELLDADGYGRAFTSDDVPALYAKVEAHRVALALLVDVEPEALAELARLAEHHDGAFVAIGTEVSRAHAEIAHSVLEAVEIGSERYALLHRSSRIGPLGSPLAFETWTGSLTWDGLVDPQALEAVVDVSTADTATALEGGFVPFVPFVTTPQAAHGGDFERTDPELAHVPAASDREGDTEPNASDAESAFLLEQLAAGPLPARIVQRRGSELGYSVRTLRRRAVALGIERRKTSMRGPWLWVPAARAAQA